MIPILETERPVGEVPRQLPGRGIERPTRLRIPLREPDPRLSARLVHPQLIEATAKYPDRVPRLVVAHAEEQLVAYWWRCAEFFNQLAVDTEQRGLQGRAGRDVED